MALTQERYLGINHTQLTELLAEREGVMLSRPTVRQLLVRAGLSSSRPRREGTVTKGPRLERSNLQALVVKVPGSFQSPSSKHAGRLRH